MLELGVVKEDFASYNYTNMRVLSSSDNHIDSEIGGISDTFHWLFTGFYCNPVTTDCIYSWNLLRSFGIFMFPTIGGGRRLQQVAEC